MQNKMTFKFIFAFKKKTEQWKLLSKLTIKVTIKTSDLYAVIV